MAGRIVIPIHNPTGELVAYAGRWPGDPPEGTSKYKLPAGFGKSLELFNLHRAKEESDSQTLIIVEGFFGAIKLWQMGLRRVVALMGSSLSPAQEALIVEHTSSQTKVLVMLDEDDAGNPRMYWPTVFTIAIQLVSIYALTAFTDPGYFRKHEYPIEIQFFLMVVLTLVRLQENRLDSLLRSPLGVPVSPNLSPQVSPKPDSGLYAHVDRAEVEYRQSTLNDARQFLGDLSTSAENPENKKTLDDSITEVDAFAKLLPSRYEDTSQPTPPTAAPREPLNAENVAARIAEIRKGVCQAVLSSWALDEADDKATQAAGEEQGKFLASESQVKQLSGELRLQMALVITAGMALGVFFLLIGDWTQKSSTELMADPWCQLIENVAASPSDVYATVEQSVAKRKVPGLEITREFWHEGGALSAKREYLRFARERLVFEICAAPFGTGFFLSFRAAVIPLVIDPLAIFCVLFLACAALSGLVYLFGLLWGAIILAFSSCVLIFLMRTALARGLANVDRVLMTTPLVGPLYELFLRHDTYYRLDTRAMYVQAVQNAVSEAFQSMFGDQGVNLLSATVSKPALENIYRKRF
jgi:hypothetical protein